jgi:hypothetical protein
MSHKRPRFSEGLDLSILPDTDTNQPGCASLAKPLALPIALHHRRERRQGAPCLGALERRWDAHSGRDAARTTRQVTRNVSEASIAELSLPSWSTTIG